MPARCRWKLDAVDRRPRPLEFGGGRGLEVGLHEDRAAVCHRHAVAKDLLEIGPFTEPRLGKARIVGHVGEALAGAGQHLAIDDGIDHQEVVRIDEIDEVVARLGGQGGGDGLLIDDRRRHPQPLAAVVGRVDDVGMLEPDAVGADRDPHLPALPLVTHDLGCLLLTRQGPGGAGVAIRKTAPGRFDQFRQAAVERLRELWVVCRQIVPLLDITPPHLPAGGVAEPVDRRVLADPDRRAGLRLREVPEERVPLDAAGIFDERRVGRIGGQQRPQVAAVKPFPRWLLGSHEGEDGGIDVESTGARGCPLRAARSCRGRAGRCRCKSRHGFPPSRRCRR